MADALKQNGPPDKPPGYKVIQLPIPPSEATVLLNSFEQDGWRVVCSYGNRNIILKRGYDNQSQ